MCYVDPELLNYKKGTLREVGCGLLAEQETPRPPSAVLPASSLA